MKNDPHQTQDTLALLRQLYPELDEGQLLEAREHLRAYLAVVLRIFKRVEAEKKAAAHIQPNTEHHIR